MSKIAQTPVMRSVDKWGSEAFEARKRDTATLNACAIVCADELRDYFCLPQKVSEVWLIAYDAPGVDRLEVILKGCPHTWVSCEIYQGYIEFFTDAMDRYLIKHLKLKRDEPQTLYIECEYR